MSVSFSSGSILYKGVFLLLLIFIILEYFFSIITNTKYVVSFGYNFTRLRLLTRENQKIYEPFLKKLVIYSEKCNTSYNMEPRLIRNRVTTNISIHRDLYNNKDDFTTLYDGTIKQNYDSEAVVSSTEMPWCSEYYYKLFGRIEVEKFLVPTIRQLEQKFSSWLMLGGHWSPDTCKTEKSIAIIIPYRNRGKHLLLFLQHMHPFLKMQQLDYTIFIIEQDSYATSFNRAMLMNIGYIEALKLHDFDCFIFHDIDLLPEDIRNLYTCPHQPRHMSVAVDVVNYRLPYPTIFGGVSAISKEHFKLLNGFSNSFWGWGGEDDDLSNRIRYHHLFISRYPIAIARYTMLGHKKNKANPSRFEILKQGFKRFHKDGLNSLKYEKLQMKQNMLYTWILVKIEKPT